VNTEFYTIQIGDTVRHNSDAASPNMVVYFFNKIEGDMTNAHCRWWDRLSQMFKDKQFNARELTLIQRASFITKESAENV
jgi:peroxiredoxin